MKTIALRFSEIFSPDEGTIYHHQKILDENGYVWYGKFGSAVSKTYLEEILKSDDPKFLLIQSGGTGRYWIHFCDACKNVPDKEHIPAYYRDVADKFKTWFKVTRIEKADRDVMSKCIVISSKSPLSHASMYSMSPYFKIEYKEQ